MAENPEASLNDILTQFVPQVPSILSDPENLYGASIGAGMGGGFYTVGALAGYPGRKAREKAAKDLEGQQRKAEEAVATSAWFKTLIDESDKLDLKGKTELFQEYLRSGHISGLPETAYLTPEGVLELEAGGLLEAVGLDAEKAMQDAGNGRDVRVSVPQVVAGVTGENAESVVRHLKLSTEGISAAQAETLDPGESFRRTQEMLEGYHARTRASDDIRQELVAQYLNAKPGADLMEAEAETAPLVAFAEKIGPVAGMTPDEYIKERLAGIVGEDVGVQDMGEAAQGLGQDVDGITYNQDGQIVTDNENFKRWFGDSKVVDEEGKPLVVYHGTTADFDAFATDKIGTKTDPGFLAAGFSFSANPQYASMYAEPSVTKTGAQKPQVYPVYLSVKNPFTVFSGEDNKAAWRELGVTKFGQEGAREKTEALRARGYDGVVSMHRASGVPVEISVFDPAQIKSVFNRGTFDPADPKILMQGADSLGFFSPTAKAIEAMDFNTIPPADLINRIKKTPGVKQEELDDLGLLDWLGGVEGKVSKEQVLDFIQNGGPHIEEVVKGTSEPTVTQEMIDEAEARGDWDEQGRLTLVYEDQQLGNNANDSGNDTKFANYQLPGGENYREVLLTVPRNAQMPALTAKYIGGGEYDVLYPNGKKLGTVRASSEEEAVQKAWERSTAKVVSSIDSDFKSSHWSEPNVLAHFRLNDRTDADGNKVLFIEEIQSDWHQAGRKKGYVGSAKRLNGAERSRLVEYDLRLAEMAAEGRQFLDEFSMEENQDFTALMERRNAEDGTRSGVPDAPFKKTETWALLAFKRVLRMAAEEGYDSVAWTPGEVQAERYDLSKRFEKIKWARIVRAENAADGENHYEITPVSRDTSYVGDEREESIEQLQDIPESRLADAIGKELAGKIVASKPRVGTLENADLKVGGEGMKGFYDKIMPNEVGKYVKKLDKKAKVGVSELDAFDDTSYKVEMRINPEGTGDYRIRKGGVLLPETFKDSDDAWQWVEDAGEKQEVWSLPITDKMREEVLKGQALYQNRTHKSGAKGSISTIADGRHVIKLFGAANKSTLLHETGHFFFLEYERIVESGKAPEWMKRDYEALRQWSGMDKAKTEDEKRAAHEKVARGFEAYLRTGKAPSLPLQRYFSMFKRWLTAIYRSVRELDVKLTPAVRDVFDRALATDEQIAEMRHAEEESRRPFRDVAEAIPGLTEAELKELEDLESEAEAEAYAILDAKLNRDRQKRILEWTKEAVDIWNETRLGQFLSGGKIGIEGMKVDFDASTVRSILRKRPGKVVKGGLPYDMAATQYGYEDGEAMVMELLEGPTKTEFVQQYLDQLEARHDRTLLEDHEGQSEAHVRFLDLQAELLARKLPGYKPVTREELEAKARGSVDGMAPAEVRDFADRTRKTLNDLGREVAEVRKALEAAIRERDTAQTTRQAEAERLRNEKAQAEMEGRADAMRESNRADAAENRADLAEGVIPVIEKERARLYRAVERQRQLHADYKASQHAKQEQKRIVSYLKRVGKAAKNGKAMTADANEQIRTVLDGLDLRNVSNRELDRRENLAAWVQAREMEGIPYPLPERVIADLGRVHYKRMSLEDLREISMLVKFIETQGRADKKAIVAGERYEFNEVRQKLVETGPTCQTVVCDLDIVDEFCFGSL